MLGNPRKYSEKLGNTRKSSEILGKKGSCLCASLQPCVPMCIPVYPPEILENARQYPSIRREILRNNRKCSEILGNSRDRTRKSSGILGNILPVRFAAPLFTPVFPCVPPGNTRKCSTILLNPAGNSQKYPEMLGNTRKNSEKLGNTRKSSEMLGKKGFCLCALLHLCVHLCPPVYPPEILGNARQYPSIRREILSNTRKCSEILGNSRKNSEILGNPRKYSETRGYA